MLTCKIKVEEYFVKVCKLAHSLSGCRTETPTKFSNLTCLMTPPMLCRMPGAAQEREASADSRAKAFKNKGKDNEVSTALKLCLKVAGNSNYFSVFHRSCAAVAMRCLWSCGRPRRRTCSPSAATSRSVSAKHIFF